MSKQEIIYWPGTKIPKSQGNAFDWRSSASKIASDKEFLASQHSSLISAGNGADSRKVFTIYSKAKASK